jgi:hypothetical protein
LAWIDKPRALKRQLIPVAKRVILSKSKLFSAVACPKTNVAEFSHPLDQCGQTRCYFRFSPLVINKLWKQMLVHPLGENVHINKKPLLGSTFLAALKGGIQVLLSGGGDAVITQY